LRGGFPSFGMMRVFGTMLLGVWFGELKIWSLGVEGWEGWGRGEIVDRGEVVGL